ncbi:MAG: hypothetical protein NC918_00240 [Candidatus Omnitrophica bacterium]|nr:hypothetical protein [Candidatus Omnitrophota bacterium]
MIIFDKFSVLLYGLILGICGLPLAFYLYRNEKEYGLFEKILFGYGAGLTLFSSLFILELIIGLKYQASLIYINWTAIFLIGLALNIKEVIKNKVNFINFLKIDFSKLNLEDVFTKIIVGFFIFAIFWIGYGASVIPIMDLDPYFYLDGVRQVIYEGYNYFDDKTAWYPLPISSHIGNPVWKYTIASWFSLYNKSNEYDPYILVAVGSVYPPIIGALAVFFIYLLFRELYDKKTAILTAGALAFAPIMMIKFQGGDFQIEPYNILAFVFSIYGFVYFFKREILPQNILVLAISLITLYLGSNIGSFFSMFFTIIISILAILNYLYPQQWLKIEKIFLLVGLIIGMLGIYFIYEVVSKAPLVPSLIKMIKNVIPYFFSILIYFLFNNTKILKQDKDIYTKIGIVFLFLFFATLFLLIITFEIHQIKDYVLSFIGSGGYTVPLVRTIAEQSPGPSSYMTSLGFFGEDYSHAQRKERIDGSGFDVSRTINLIKDTSLIAQLNNYRVVWFNTISYPSLFIDIIYYLFNEFGNLIAGKNSFIYIPKNISFFSLATFFALFFSIINAFYSLKKEKKFDIVIALTLALLPVLLVSFGKQKFVMYCALIGIFYVGIFFGGFLRFFEEIMQRYNKEKIKLVSIALFNIIGVIAIFFEPSLLLAGLFSLAFGSILIMLFYDYFLEKRNVAFFVVVLVLVALQFFGPYLISLEIFNLNSTNPSKFFEQLIGDYNINAYLIFVNSFTPRVYDNPNKVIPLMFEECKNKGNQDLVCYTVEQIANRNYSNLNPFYYYNSEMCVRSLLVQEKKISIDQRLVYIYRCSMVDYYWLDAMEWIRKNTPKDARIISWWDYGHWINFFGQRNAVIRNDQASLEMIGQTAAAFLHKDLNFLKKTMKEFGAEYAFFDVQIVGSGNSKQDVQLGGKYHALNYLGCAWQNKTNVSFYPGESECEREHTWEQIIIPKNAETCTISREKNISGIVGYEISYSKANAQFFPIAKYCFTQEYTQDGVAIRAYSLNEKDLEGNLKLKKAEWKAYNTENGILLVAFYTKLPQWKEKDGTIVDGWGDRTKKYYDSNLYSAFFFDELEGFKLVYNTPQIRIFKLIE